ncbi:hypothetical protein Vretimale_19374 [Volvox reticuliferus]|uniref:Uncharacterized protein n=1 Tax=Volvox reticuliferus TaxID=1737510 RepID=A0A8J4D5N7_9CHLO|nr:hypothetical protein Vretifemale_20608 [Volvox reticuliferus]GIM16779.1 hypothetical protein Vretimale_19374 [Volvox reticuliferus]
MSCLNCSTRGIAVVRASPSRPLRRVRQIAPRAAETKQDAATTSGPSPSASSDKPTFTREFTANGARIIETDGKLSGPEDDKDFWEGENMETFGKVMERFFIPGLVVLGLICGGIAARSYNDEADVFIAPPPGPDADVVVIPAGAFVSAPVVVQAPSVDGSD